MKKRLNEHPVKTYARRMLREGEIENAEASLAAKDQVDRLQDMVEELGKMTNEELPKLVDKIRGSIGSEQATVYQQSASGILSELLNIVTEKKAALEQAVLVLTGDAQAELGPKTELELPDEELDTELKPEDNAKVSSPLGREPRLPAAESRKFNKSLSEAKIVALKKALDETDTKKFPNRARRLAEELRRVATVAIKEEAKNLKMKNVASTSKEMLKVVKESAKQNCSKCKGTGLNKAKYENGKKIWCAACKGKGTTTKVKESVSKTEAKAKTNKKKVSSAKEKQKITKPQNIIEIPKPKKK